MGGLLQIGFLTSFRRSNVITIALGVFAAAIAVYPADVSYAAPDQENQARRSRATRESGSNPPYAAMVLDGNSGKVLHSASADELRHPASLTKIMTLYLLFERLEAGKLRLDTRLPVSEYASVQAPTKLGLTPDQTIAGRMPSAGS